HRRNRGAVDEQHIDVEEDLDQHQRRVEHSVAEEKQPDRDRDRREAVAQRAVDEGGDEGDDDERDDSGFHGAGNRSRAAYSLKDDYVRMLFQISYMKLQQLRCLAEVARRGLNVSEAAEALHTSQPGVSKQIRALEDELGIQVFARHGKRLVEITEPGKAVIAIAERILAEANNLRRAGEEYANENVGSLTIATTHTQARYSLQ